MYYLATAALGDKKEEGTTSKDQTSPMHATE
jgi:hypothetical protein